eukprot:20591-Lingulodinium_polyedra.AAC.1
MLASYESCGVRGRFVHCCCEPVKRLSETIGKEMEVINVTLHHDFCQAETARRIRELMTGSDDVLFYCSPCTGGSQLQHANRA